MSVSIELQKLNQDQISTIINLLTMIAIDPDEEERKKRRGVTNMIPPKPKVSISMFEIDEKQQYIKLPYTFASALFKCNTFNHNNPHVKYVNGSYPEFKVQLRDYQIPLVHEASQIMAQHSTVILGLVAGSGKCFSKDTEILNAYGGVTLAKDIKVGDLLIGDNNTYRRVLSTCTGIDNMYEIIPTKGRSFICNEPHVLTLKGIMPHTHENSIIYSIDGHIKTMSFETKDEADTFLLTLKDDIFDIPLNEYMKQDDAFKNNTYLYHAPFNWKHRDVPINPYIIGYWLGDGYKSTILCQNPEIITYLKGKCSKYNLEFTKTSYIAYSIGSTKHNHFSDTLRQLKLIDNKHIPLIYKLNSRTIRLKLLAGLIDSDGYMRDDRIILMQKNIKLADDIEYLCFSLGFMVTKTTCIWHNMRHIRLDIFGEGLDCIPVINTRVLHDLKTLIKQPTCYNFKVKPLGVGEYCGFTLDGNGRFLLGDFLVTHNTIMGTMLSWYGGYSTLVLMHRIPIAESWVTTFNRCFGEEYAQQHVWYVGEQDQPTEPTLIVCMDERVDQIPDDVLAGIGTLIIDEAPCFCTPSRVHCLLKCQPRYIIAESATFKRLDGMHQMIEAITGTHGIFKIADIPYHFIAIKTRVKVEVTQTKFGMNFDSLCKGLMNNQYRNGIILDIIRTNPHRKFMVICRQVEHAKILETMLQHYGIEHDSLYRNKRQYSDSHVLVGVISKMGIGFDEATFCKDFKGFTSNCMILACSIKKVDVFEQCRNRMRNSNSIVIWLNDDNGVTKAHLRGLKPHIELTKGTIISVEYFPGQITLPQLPSTIKPLPLPAPRTSPDTSRFVIPT